METIEESLDLSTDEALISALTPKRVGELELQPFSVMRQLIASDICFPSHGICNQVITVWVCTLSPTEALKAREDVVTARQAALDWAEAQGYSILNYAPLLAVYARLNRELTASTDARARGGSEDGAKNDGGQPLP